MLQAQPAQYVSPLLSSRLDKQARQRQAIAEHLSRQPADQRDKFNQAVEAILTTPSLDPLSKLIALTIAHMNRINYHKVTLARIRKRTGIRTDGTVIERLRLMEELGVLRITRAAGLTSQYDLMIPFPFSA